MGSSLESPSPSKRGGGKRSKWVNHPSIRAVCGPTRAKPARKTDWVFYFLRPGKQTGQDGRGKSSHAVEGALPEPPHLLQAGQRGWRKPGKNVGPVIYPGYFTHRVQSGTGKPHRSGTNKTWPGKFYWAGQRPEAWRATSKSKKDSMGGETNMVTTKKKWSGSLISDQKKKRI